VAYVGQFDNLVREQDRGHAIRNTRTIAVFDDGVAVCPVSVSGGPPRSDTGIISSLILARRASRPGGRGGSGPAHGADEIRLAAQALGADANAVAFAEMWPRARPIPAAVIESITLRRPRQVSELIIDEQTSDPGRPERSVFLGDLAAEQVRDLLGPLLGGRLTIDIAD
jgi:hypothetical protein